MLLALGAASSLIDAFKSLTQTKAKSSSPQATGFTQSSTNPFDSSSSTSTSASPAPASGPTGFSQISPSTMSALLAAQSQSSTATTTSTSSSSSTSPSSALQDLFSQIDANGDGQISKDEFESALGAGGTNTAQADDVFSKMDKNGDGSVSLDEMSSALKGTGGKGGHHHHNVASSDGSSATGNSCRYRRARRSSRFTKATPRSFPRRGWRRRPTRACASFSSAKASTRRGRSRTAG